MRSALYAGIGIGAVITLLALVDIVRIAIVNPDKAAYYLMGHWVDVFWQLQLPALFLGLVMVAGCLQLLNHVKR